MYEQDLDIILDLNEKLINVELNLVLQFVFIVRGAVIYSRTMLLYHTNLH
jgi:hypothetical protein